MQAVHKLNVSLLELIQSKNHMFIVQLNLTIILNMHIINKLFIKQKNGNAN